MIFILFFNSLIGGESISQNLKETIITENIPFNVVIPVVEKTEPTGNERTRITGLSRTTEVSLNHLKTTENFISSIKKQVTEAAKSGSPIPSFLDHDPNKVIGSIVGVKESPKDEFWPITELLEKSGNDVVDAPVMQVEHWLNQNVRLGKSISGHLTESKWIEDLDSGDWWIEANDGILFEDTITPIPAQIETNGTLIKQSCENGFCNQLESQVLEYLTKNDNPIREALKEKTEQREEIKQINKDNMEVKTMTEDNERLDKIEESLNKISTYINKDIEAKEQAEKEAKEKQAREEIKKELKDEIVKEFSEEVVPSIAEAFDKGFDKKFGELIGDRNHVQKSAQETKNVKEEVKETQITEQTGKDPKKSIAENRQSVIMGKTVKGYTPDEMFA